MLVDQASSTTLICAVESINSSILFNVTRVVPLSDGDSCGVRQTKIANNETCTVVSATVCVPNDLEINFGCEYPEHCYNQEDDVCTYNFTFAEERNVNERTRMQVEYSNITCLIWSNGQCSETGSFDVYSSGNNP